MTILKTANLGFVALLMATKSFAAQQQPNILWILTDDHRYDAIAAFNEMLTGKKENALGEVESPQIDKLTKMGTTFINTYCQAQVCAPSRTSMQYGRYTFRSGVFGFEYYNRNAEHMRLTVPEEMVKLGYQTMCVGKTDLRVRNINEDGKPEKFDVYQTSLDKTIFHDQYLTGWGKTTISELNGKKLPKPVSVQYFVAPDGTVEYSSEALEKMCPEYAGTGKKIQEKYGHIRSHARNLKETPFYKNVIGGVSSQPAGKTRDGYYTKAFIDYLSAENGSFNVGEQTFDGVNPSKPVFCFIGYDFPHTPVLPPVEYRERFAKKHYNIPKREAVELETMPTFMRKMTTTFQESDHFSDEKKLTMIQDYYAFSAYGDSLVGKSVDTFIKYSEKHNQPWMIFYVNGDHGWKLNEHGAIGKNTPWEIDTHNPIVVVSSDKTTYPAGKVVRNLTEFVDIAPSILTAAGADVSDEKFEHLDGLDLAKTASGEIEPRDFVVAENGSRAYIRTKDYMLTINSRRGARGEGMDWAINASYKDLDTGLYYLPNDPHELKNLANNPEYQDIAIKLKNKLLSVLFDDKRVETDWGKGGVGGKVIYRMGDKALTNPDGYKLEL